MPKLTIDNKPVEVPPGATLLDAAEKLGIDIPRLCHLPDAARPSTSCLVCLVRLSDSGKLVPACATRAVDGMNVESETPEVFEARRTALELLLADHIGDCLAPCVRACPVGLDIPRMLRQIETGDLAAAAATLQADMSLPRVLARICPAPCEKSCRRDAADGAVAICRLKQFVADQVDLTQGKLTTAPPTGRRVAIIGAGPSGLSAAYHAAIAGNHVVVFDRRDRPGGRLLDSPDADTLPIEVLNADIQPIRAMGVDFLINHEVSVADVRRLSGTYDAVIVAAESVTKSLQAEDTPIPQNVKLVRDKSRAKISPPRRVADGRAAAESIAELLSSGTSDVTTSTTLPDVKLGKLEASELVEFMKDAPRTARVDIAPDDSMDAETAQTQSARCLHCDCRQLHNCDLRTLAARYGATPARRQRVTVEDNENGSREVPRRHFQRIIDHPELVYEPGKCIRCSRCIEVARTAGEPVGLTLSGRGFDVEVVVPLGQALSAGITHSARLIAAACPTGSLALRKDDCKRQDD